jgi:threonyl-tRNA synthetase
MSKVLLKDGSIMNTNEIEERRALRHTTAHILAQAVKRIYPKAKLAIGPAIESGFYYDFDMEETLTLESLVTIEEEMKKIVKDNLKLERFVLPRAKALRLMEEAGESYKIELINELPEDQELTFFKQGEFIDLCAGPHIVYTSGAKAFKLLSVAGAYWRGNEKNKMLQRVYGTAFGKKSDLEEYLKMLEEAKKRDHRKLGKELKLFTIMNEGPGFPFFLPKGVVFKNKLIEYWRELHKKYGYVEIETPLILNKELWETSGHWFHYKENMYTLNIDEEEYAIKPMNCPGGMLVYKQETHSYRELPIRAAELGRVHRHELSGTLHGLMRVKALTQDDAHIFMLPQQIKDEIIGVVRLIDEVYEKFGFKYKVELSTRPENSMGSDEEWAMAEDALQKALEEINMPFKINEGDGAFYGPKIDFHLQDSIGRTWQCGTIQLDFQLPQRFDLEYVGRDGEKHKPIVIHRVIFGSIERFIGILIEHFEGKFPVWMAPVQVKVLPISEQFNGYGEKVVKALEENNIRVELDDRAEKIGYKIREARSERVPYIIIIGEKEQSTGSIALRSRQKGDEGCVDINEFISRICDEIDKKMMDN